MTAVETSAAYLANLLTEELSPESSAILSAPGNGVCFDCGAVDPEWVSIQHATVVCIGCAGEHRALGPALSVGTVLFLMRVVLSWFPKYNLNELPWNIAAWPTEPILKPTRALVPPVAGVDVSPLIWVGILTFLSEILVGPQGILSIIERKG